MDAFTMDAFTMDAFWRAPGPRGDRVLLDGEHRPGGRDPWLRWFGQGGWADTAPGSGWLALQAHAVSRPEVLRKATSDEVLGIGRAWRALETWAFARKLTVVRELIRRHPRDERYDPEGAGGLPGEWEPSLHQEVAAALGISVVAAGKLVRLAWTLDTRLRGTGQALEDGRLDPARVRLIADEASVLQDEALFPRAEAIILDGLPGCTTWGALLRLVQRAVITVDPDGARRRREQAEREHARVRFWRENCGTCAMQATGLPADEALAANANIEARAREYKNAGVARPVDILRVMAFVDLLNGVTVAQRAAWARADDAARQAEEAGRQARGSTHPDGAAGSAGQDPETGDGPGGDRPDGDGPRGPGDDGPGGPGPGPDGDGPGGPDRGTSDGGNPEDDSSGRPGGDGPSAPGRSDDGAPDGGGPENNRPGGPDNDGPIGAGDDTPGGPGDNAPGRPDGGAPDGGGPDSDGPDSDGLDGGAPDDRSQEDDGPGGPAHNPPGSPDDAPDGGNPQAGDGGDPSDWLPGHGEPRGEGPGDGPPPQDPGVGHWDSGPGRPPCPRCGGAGGGTGLPVRASLTIPAGALEWLAGWSARTAGTTAATARGPTGAGAGAGGGGPGWRYRGGPGPCPACGTQGSASMPAREHLVLPLLTLAGLASRPGEAHGLGALDPALARDLAAAGARHPGSQFCLTVAGEHGHAIGHGCCKPMRGRKGAAIPVDPDRITIARSGRSGPDGGFGSWILTLPGMPLPLIVDIDPVPTHDCDHRFESRAYRPGERLRHLVQVRDGECSFPACSRHARESDFEHGVPYGKGGRTCACNAHACSRSCHRAKQSPGWRVTKPRPGWTQWTTRAGRIYVQGPWSYPA